MRPSTRRYNLQQKCRICKEDAHSYWLTKHGYVCDHCKLRIEPPTMIVTEFLSNNKGFDRRFFNGTFKFWEVVMDMKDLQDCGWFIRQIIEYPGTSKTYHLEYHGKKRCGRFTTWNYPYEFRMCPNISCPAAIHKKRAQYGPPPW